MKSRTFKIILALIILVCVFPIYKGLSATMQARHASSPGTTLDDGLVGHWTFDGADMTSSTALDKSGNSNTGTLTNMSTSSRVAGIMGQGLLFDGTDDFINMYGSFNFTSSDFTISHWVKLNSLSTNIGGQGPVLVYKGSYQTNGYYSQVASDGALFFATNQSGAAQSSSVPANTIVPGNWYHISYVRRGASVRIYVNGIDKTSVAGTHINPASSSGDFRIGQYFAPSISMNGLMDDVRIYNRALTPDEIHQLYKMGEGTTMGVDPTSDSLAEGLAGYWKFDEGQGSTTIDSSVNHNNGTTTNMSSSTKWTSGKIGGALTFDGTDDYVELGSSIKVDNSSQGAISTWVKIAGAQHGSGVGGIFCYGGASTGQLLLRVGSTGTYTFQIFQQTDGGGSDVLKSTRTLTTNTWYHLVLVSNGTSYTMYIDGTPETLTVTSGSNTGDWFSDTTATEPDKSVLGARYVGGIVQDEAYLNGSLDEFRVYNRPLSQDEVATLYRTTKPTEVDTSLVGHWTFDGPTISGTTVRDLSGAGNNGTLTNGPTKTAGVLGQALLFDGSDDYVSAGGNVAFSSGTSISFWMKSSPILSHRGIMDWGAGAGSGTGVYIHHNSSVDVRMYFIPDGWANGSISADVSDVTDNSTWSLWALVADGSQLKLYKQGVLVTTTSYTSPDKAMVAIASYDAGQVTNFGGSLDDVRIYNRALTADEIYKMYRVGAGSKMNVDTVTPDLERGLAGYWPLDNGSGVTASDLSVNGNNGTLTDGPTWSAGKVGGSVSFDGSNDWISLQDSPAFDFGGRGTFCNWFYSAANQTSAGMFSQDITSYSETTFKWMTYLTSNSGVLSAYVRIGGTAYSASGPSMSSGFYNNSWHHICGIFDKSLASARLKIYIDGTLAGSHDATTGDVDSGNKPSLGTWWGGFFFNGKIDEARIYNRALSAEEVATLYRTTKPTQASDGLVGYWPFNGPDVTDKIYDRSGAGNNGYFVGGATTSAKTIGQVGQGMSFNGSNQYINIGDVSYLDSVSAATFTGWVYITDNSSMRTFVSKDNYAPDHFILKTADFPNGPQFSININGTTYVGTISSPLSVNSWHHLSYVFDGTQTGNSNRMKIYVNGVSQSLTYIDTIPATLPGNISSDLRIGSDQRAGRYFAGIMDEVRIYNRVLSAQEVKQLYNAGR